jgi:hypothetical protein
MRLAATWFRPQRVKKGKSIARSIFELTSYAMNPEKTEGGKLVAGYCCDPRTVDDEFLLTKKEQC